MPNYFRALQWAAAMTFIAHTDPAFSSVFGIEAINEPTMDATQTPGYGDCEHARPAPPDEPADGRTDLVDFVRVVRAVELALGIRCPGGDDAALVEPGPARASATATGAANGTASASRNTTTDAGGRVRRVLASAAPLFEAAAGALGAPDPRLRGGAGGRCLRTACVPAPRLCAR